MILDQRTYDRLNAFDVSITDLEVVVAKLASAVMQLEDTVFPLVEVEEPEDESLNTEGTVEEEPTLLAIVAANAGKDKTNGPSKEKPKAKKKTVRKTS